MKIRHHFVVISVLCTLMSTQSVFSMRTRLQVTQAVGPETGSAQKTEPSSKSSGDAKGAKPASEDVSTSRASSSSLHDFVEYRVVSAHQPAIAEEIGRIEGQIDDGATASLLIASQAWLKLAALHNEYNLNKKPALACLEIAQQLKGLREKHSECFKELALLFVRMGQEKSSIPLSTDHLMAHTELNKSMVNSVIDTTLVVSHILSNFFDPKKMTDRESLKNTTLNSDPKLIEKSVQVIVAAVFLPFTDCDSDKKGFFGIKKLVYTNIFIDTAKLSASDKDISPFQLYSIPHMPFCAVVKDVAEILKITVQCGTAATQQAIKIVRNDHSLIVQEKSIVKAVAKVAKKINDDNEDEDEAEDEE